MTNLTGIKDRVVLALSQTLTSGAYHRRAISWFCGFFLILTFSYDVYLANSVGHMDDYSSLWQVSREFRTPGVVPATIMEFFTDARPVSAFLMEIVTGSFDSIADFRYFRLISFAAFSAFFALTLPLIFGRDALLGFTAFILISASGAFIVSINWAMVYIGGTCFLFLGFAFVCFWHSQTSATWRHFLLFGSFLFLVITLLMVQTTWALYPWLIFLACLNQPHIFFRWRPVLESASLFVLSLMVSLGILRLLRNWHPEMMISDRDRFDFVNLETFPLQVKRFLLRTAPEQIGFLGFGDIVEWPIMLAAIAALSLFAFVYLWRQGNRLLAVLCLLAAPFILLWCNFAFLILELRSWPYRVQLGGACLLAILGAFYFQIAVRKMANLAVFGRLAMLGLAVAALLIVKHEVIFHVHRSEFVELQLVRKFTDHLPPEINRVYVEQSSVKAKRPRYRIYDDAGTPSLYALWAVDPMMQLAYYEAHGRKFNGEFIQVAEGSLGSLQPGECVFRAPAILAKFRSPGSVRKYVPSCE